MRLRIHIVDDDPAYATIMRYQLRRNNDPDISVFHTGEEAIEHIDEEPDLVLLDVVMPGQGGLETLRQMKARKPDIPVVMVSAQSVVSVALEALKLGAYDYITKGHDDTVKLQALVRHISERAALAQEVNTLRAQLPDPRGLQGIVGESAPMARIFKIVQKTLRGNLTVAVLGESGTGKELIAQAIHQNSNRRRHPFVVVNCAAIPHELMESEFFGHEKGSFTGAHARKIGKFEQAHQGTIFLDEIGELELSLQAKLLRVLQNQEVQRVGGSETIKVDVRVICATNKDIVQMTRENKFREDLYYRLFQFPVHLPPLRERDQDVLLLAEHFRKSFLKKHTDLEQRAFSAATRRVMLQYEWPGNVRELKNAVERALLISDGREIMPDDLMLDNALHATSTSVPAPTLPSPEPSVVSAMRTTGDTPVVHIVDAQTADDILTLEEVKKIAVEHAYKLCKGNIERTAVKLGVTRSTIYRLMKKYDIPQE